MELNKENFRKEVSSFRAGFQEDAIQKSEKSFFLEKRGNVAVLVLDQFQDKANVLSSPNMLRLFDLFTQVEEDKDIGALVIISRKPSIFVAGADISEIKRMAAGEATVESLMKLQAVFTYLEKLPIPSIAAIHGACMGGGTELTLACDYRIASDAPETRIALPEILLGVIPGWGGTQRLPRLIGLEQSLNMILNGNALDARKAKKVGLVDKVAPKEVLEEKAVAWATELAKTRKKRKSYDHELKDRLQELPGARLIVFDKAKKTVLKKTKGNYPAHLKAIEVVRKTFGGDIEKGLRVEAEAFGELVLTKESEALIGVYYLNEKVKKDKGVDTKIAGKEIKNAAVVGAGVMGGGIAQLFSAKGTRVRMKDISWDAIAKGYQAAYKIFAKQVERKKMKKSDLDNTMARIEGTTTYAGFKNVDLVVEAVVESVDVKKKIFAELDGIVDSKTFLATNTSSLSVTEIGRATKNPARVVGMHFFNPVDKMPLVEVIRGADTSDEAVATIFQYSKKLGKTPIVVKDSPGFVVNRILGPYLLEAGHLMFEGVGVEEMDRLLEKFGMPMGPAALLDEIGLDVANKVVHVLYGAFGERMKPNALIDIALADKRLGKKNGKGIYLYESGKRKGADPVLLNKVAVQKKNIPADIIVKRLIYIMVNEAARCLEEKLVRDVSDIDVGMIFGTGFAPFRGGLLRYADSVGPDAIVSDLDIFARTYGPRFTPCQYLQQLAVSNKKFYA
jgi:3-hydroxyacyl-CoA dehydrogenase / enoyl-CoA hydratase / 3-hydroxybutyryl-CoA epimerase